MEERAGKLDGPVWPADGNGVTRLIAQHTASLSFDALPQELVELIKQIVLDTLGVAIGASGLAPEARLRVYRNHFRITLAEALGATFPATARLLGGDGFGGLARRFVGAHPPTRPCLAEYGVLWKASYLATDRMRMFCEFEAESAEQIRNALRSAEVRFARVWPALKYQPKT